MHRHPPYRMHRHLPHQTLDTGCRTMAEAYADIPPFPRTVLRARGGILLDSPIPVLAATWASTIWPDARLASEWDRLLWAPEAGEGRGWRLPPLALGDVVEFGAIGPGVDRRWWGITEAYEPDEWLFLIGPISTAIEASALSRLLLALAWSTETRPDEESSQRGEARHPRRCRP